MVSNTLELSLRELVARLARIKREHANDPQYKALRKEFPKSWPM